MRLLVSFLFLVIVLPIIPSVSLVDVLIASTIWVFVFLFAWQLHRHETHRLLQFGEKYWENKKENENGK